ncbi:MAG: hypothetical protein HY781_07815 [Chloroflexi bacterium]|nr:hypothetical protein [Chloroflexota bacterium]
MKPISFVVLCLFLASCGPATPDITPIPSLAELDVAEYPLKQPPEPESTLLYFADSIEGDPRLLHADERANKFYFDNWYCGVETQNPMAMCATLGDDELVAWEEYENTGFGHVIVTHNGAEIYRIDLGQGSPISALQRLWTYDDHWALETAYVTQRTEGNTIYSDVIGHITVDGELLNVQYGYEEAFGFQTIRGKPFYFFKRDGKISANYDGVEIPLDYDEVPHYNCCGYATLNPSMFQNMVAFFVRKGETWYYAEIGVFSQP